MILGHQHLPSFLLYLCQKTSLPLPLGFVFSKNRIVQVLLIFLVRAGFIPKP